MATGSAIPLPFGERSAAKQPGEGDEAIQTKRAKTSRSANQTNAEARLWQALRGRRLAQWKFRRQHPIDRYIVDFVTIEGKLIVEVDGATHSTAREITRDAERSQVLEAFGFHIVRVSNIDVYENLEGVLEMIDQTLRPS